MEPELATTIAFYVFALLAIAASIGVVANKNPVASAMCLVATFVAVAGLYLTLSATFLAAVQILVYAGAIMVLFLFVIMLLNLSHDAFEGISVRRTMGGAIAFAFIFISIGLLWSTGPAPGESVSVRPGTGLEIGRTFLRDYVFPFEMASLLLLVAMIGAIVVARRPKLVGGDR
jgi:NADH-quinone oxidoreductase subunit J